MFRFTIYSKPSLLTRIISACLLSFCSAFHLSGQQKAGNSIEIDVIQQAKADIARLSSEEMAGRGYTDAGHLNAAAFLQERFKEAGLQQLNGSYLQPFPIIVDTFKQTPELIINGKTLRFGHDFIINPGNKARSKGAIPLVDVGSGIIAEEHGINDFAGKNLRGKTAVIESNLPEEAAGDTTINRSLLTRDTRIRNAIEAHASGVILLVDRPTYGNFFERWPAPIFEVRRETLPDNATEATFSVKRSTHVPIETSNVIGFLPGTGQTDSTLIICAHYDHLGRVGPEGPYFPGANDNASGTALLLALAQTFRKQPIRYNMLFVAFSGEEIGLKGSRYFAQHSPINLEKARFLVNLDMAASGLEGVMALGGVDFPEEFALLEQVHDSLELPELRKRANAPNSDHWFILERGVRGFYLYPFTGQQPYHHINDLPATLQWKTFRRMYSLLTGFLRKL